jgi:hypothetical protein
MRCSWMDINHFPFCWPWIKWINYYQINNKERKKVEVRYKKMEV